MFTEARPTAPQLTSKPLSARQTELVDALEGLVQQERFAGLGVGELAARLNCSRSTLYAIAPSKEQLFLVVVARLLTRVQDAALAAADAAKEPKARLQGYLAGAIEQIRGIGTSFLAEIQSHPPARQLLEDFQRTSLAHLRALIEEGIEAGDFQRVNVTLAAELLDAAANRIQDPRVLAEAGVTPSEALADLMQVMTRGLNK